MSTNEVLNALSEATQAYHELPEIKRQLKAVTEDRDFLQLQLDEALAKIESLKAEKTDQAVVISNLETKLNTAENEISDYKWRVENLNKQIANMQGTMDTMGLSLNEKDIMLDLIKADKKSLEDQLNESRSFTKRLTDAIKGIGSVVHAAIPAPEVVKETTFQDGVKPVEEVSVDNNSNRSVVVQSDKPLEVEVKTEEKAELYQGYFQ